MAELEELVLELTDWCPLACRHCSSESSACRRTSLTRDVVVRLVEEAVGLGVTKVSFGGGEPTGSPILMDIVERVAGLGMIPEIFTCGVGMKEDAPASFSPGLVAALASIESANLIFSIHGATAGVDDGISQVGGSFQSKISSLDACMAAGIPCEANFVPLRPTAPHFPEIVALLSARGVRKLSILRFVPQGRGLVHRGELELSADEEDAFLASLVEVRRKSGLEIRTGSPFNGIVPGNSVPCRAGTSKLVVQADGNVIPCEVFKHHQRRDWGLSVYESSLAEILEAPRLGELRMDIAHQACVLCPVHYALRSIQESGPPHEQVSEVTVHA